MKKKIGCFLSYNQAWQISDNIELTYKRSSGSRCASYMIISVTPKRCVKTHIFEKNRLTFQGKNYLAILFSTTGVWKTSDNNL